MDAIQIEALRRFNEEKRAEREAALQRKLAEEEALQKLRNAEAAARIKAMEEEEIARQLAAERIRQARIKAEQEEHEKAVQEQLARMRARPVQEQLVAEVEELRLMVASLTTEMNTAKATPPPTYIAAVATASPWSSGLEELKTLIKSSSQDLTNRIAALQKESSQLNTELSQIKKKFLKPARTATITLSPPYVFINPANPGLNHTATIQYQIVDALTGTTSGSATTQGLYSTQAPARQCVPWSTVLSISIPANHVVQVLNVENTSGSVSKDLIKLYLESV